MQYVHHWAAHSYSLLRVVLLCCCRMLQWAVLERRRGNYAAAARCFQRGTACAPGNPHIWYAWASMTWHDLRDVRAARRLYEQATAYCPRCVRWPQV